MPLFLISYILTSYNLDYVTEVSLFRSTPLNGGQVFFQGKGKTAKEVLKRIDYGGSLFLLLTVC